VRAGARAYSTANLESGWVPSPLPAIFSGEQLTGYRQWLGTAAAGSLGGSFDAPDIADYYLTPYDLGYGRTVSFDHEFVGRAALERFAHQQNRTKVTLVWNAEDLMRMFGSWLTPGESAKYLELPKARYALYQMDKVTVGGEVVGVSLDCGYLANEQAFVSLASVDAAHSAPGSQVTVVWGEDPNSSKPQVEAHVQTEVRATVAPAPYVQFARGAYRSA
jgi:glycine cleavage system aminomethyltransferase T